MKNGAAFNHIVNVMAEGGVNNYISPGLISQLVTNGKVRMFRNTRLQMQYVTPHSHRFAFAAQVLRGTVINTLFTPTNWYDGPEYQKSRQEYSGEFGQYKITPLEVSRYTTVVSTYQSGDWYYMSADSIHSIQFSDDAVVLFFEGPTVTDSTIILQPVVDGEVCNIFTTPSWMFKR